MKYIIIGICIIAVAGAGIFFKAKLKITETPTSSVPSKTELASRNYFPLAASHHRAISATSSRGSGRSMGRRIVPLLV